MHTENALPTLMHADLISLHHAYFGYYSLLITKTDHQFNTKV